MFGKVPPLMDEFEKVFDIGSDKDELNKFLAEHPYSYILKPRLHLSYDREEHVNFELLNKLNLVIVKYKKKRK